MGTNSGKFLIDIGRGIECGINRYRIWDDTTRQHNSRYRHHINRNYRIYSNGTGAGLTFSGTGNHIINATSGTLEMGGVTLTGGVTGNGKDLTGLNNLSAGGSITFGGLSDGIIHVVSGALSSSAVDLTADVTGALPILNGGTNATSIGTNGELAYSNGTGYAFTAVGGAGQILESNGGGAPSWVSAGSVGTNYWQIVNGALSPLNFTNDLLLGSSATSSAVFAFTGVATGTPTASISGGLTGGVSLTATGILGTTNGQTLQLGNSSTGNIVVDSQSLLNLNTVNNKAITTGTGLTTLGGNLTVNGAGVTLAGNSSIIDMTGTGTLGLDTTTNRAITTGTGLTTLGGNLTVNGAGVTLAGNSSIIDMTGTGTLGLDTTTNRAITTGTGLTTLGGNLTVNGATINLGNASSTTIQTTGANTSLTLGANGTGTLLLNSSATSGVEIGSAIVTPQAPLFINGGIGNNGALIVNNTNSGDLIDASASGLTKFQVTNGGSLNLAAGQTIDTLTNGTLGIGTTNATTITIGRTSNTISLPGYNNAGGIFYSNSGTLALTGTGTGSQCLLGGSTPTWGSCSTGTANYWQQNLGTVEPRVLRMISCWDQMRQRVRSLRLPE